MRFTLDMVSKASCILFTSQVNNIILIVFNKIRNQTKKTKNVITMKLQLATISNQTLISMRYQKIAMRK